GDERLLAVGEGAGHGVPGGEGDVRLGVGCVEGGGGAGGGGVGEARRVGAGGGDGAANRDQVPAGRHGLGHGVAARHEEPAVERGGRVGQVEGGAAVVARRGEREARGVIGGDGVLVHDNPAPLRVGKGAGDRIPGGEGDVRLGV